MGWPGRTTRFLLRLQRAVKTRGVRGTIRLGIVSLIRSRGLPGSSQGAEFDRRYGTDTSGLIDQVDLDTTRRDNWVYGTHYVGSRLEFFFPALASLNIERQTFTFLDLGSGKGLAVMLAAEAGFGKAIGVEFSRLLHNVAERNITLVQSLFSCRMESVCGDAAEFALPAVPLVLYLNNPFHEPVMRSVVERAADRAKLGIPLFVVYVNPEHAQLWQRPEFIEFARANGGRWIVWRATSLPQARE